MPCWKLTITYDGTDFAGWQEQDGLRTIQATVEAGEREYVVLHGQSDHEHAEEDHVSQHPGVPRVAEPGRADELHREGTEREQPPEDGE